MKPTNILVVDDHPLYRDAFCTLLQTARPALQIIPAETGSQALSLTARIPFDLLVLDYYLKSMSGGDIIRHLRGRAAGSGWRMPPVILVSSQPEVAVFARSLGAAAFLPKPVDGEALRVALDSILPAAPEHARALGGEF
ncbi:MAG: hypothetical protein OHK0022_08310 [Roseiflexaceae bacterium]